jgi:N-dimethylarginine dimethylaminohydrolase
MVKPIGGILLKKPADAFRSQQYLDENYEANGFLGPPDMEKVLEEYEVFEGIIKRCVPEIHYLPFDARTELDSIYTHDSVKITRGGAVYFTMGKDIRCGEPHAARAYLESVGVPTLGFVEGEGRMEGGDVVWMDERTVAIGRGYRTNDEGIRQFREILGDLVDDVVVVPMPHGEGREACLHLMSIISLVDDDLAVVYSKYMPVFFREYLIGRGIELIETDDEEYDYLGSNVLALGDRKCLVIDGNPKVRKGLEDAGAEVFAYPGRNLSYLGVGGPTCLTCPVARGD